MEILDREDERRALARPDHQRVQRLDRARPDDFGTEGRHRVRIVLDAEEIQEIGQACVRVHAEVVDEATELRRGLLRRIRLGHARDPTDDVEDRKIRNRARVREAMALQRDHRLIGQALEELEQKA